MTVLDSFALGVMLPSGTYDLTLTVQSPDGYAQPMTLAMEGQAADGSYRIGSIIIR